MDMPTLDILPFRPVPLTRPRLEQVTCACGQELLAVRRPRDRHQPTPLEEVCDGCRRERPDLWRMRD